MINLSNLSVSSSALYNYDPEFSYVNLCIDQQIYFQSSVNQGMLFFILIAWILLILASYTFKIEKYNKYHESILHMVRLSLVLVIATWFLFVYLGIVWFN